MIYQLSIFKRYHSGKHFSEFLPRRWRQKSTGIDMEQKYVTVIVLYWRPRKVCMRLSNELGELSQLLEHDATAP